MILGFKQFFPWHTEKNPAPTYFREKILFGAGYITNVEKTFHGVERTLVKETDIKAIEIHKQAGAIPKLHTMRLDPHDRWKPGMSIQMVYRGPKYSIDHHFNEGIPELQTCISVQKIKLWFTGSLGEFENGERKQEIRMHAIVDGKRIDNPELLIKNDGFTNLYDFSRWFKGTWEGKIIHWTDFRY